MTIINFAHSALHVNLTRSICCLKIAVFLLFILRKINLTNILTLLECEMNKCH